MDNILNSKPYGKSSPTISDGTPNLKLNFRTFQMDNVPIQSFNSHPLYEHYPNLNSTSNNIKIKTTNQS